MASPNPQLVRTKTEFAAGLTAIRRGADLSIRDLTKLTGIPSGTLGGYFSGRNLPLPGQLSNLRRVLAACGVPSDQIEQWTETVERVRTASATRPPSPFPGLTSFGITDAAVFFGRERETDDLLARLARLRRDPGASRGILAVIGASGSGKTSLLRAGVASHLATPDDGAFLVRTPGVAPNEMLARARAELGDQAAVLVIDQFEELFTLTSDPDERRRFLAELVTLAPRTLVVIGMRADFYATATAEPDLVGALQHAQLLLGPLGPDELRQAITRPAETVGVTVEAGLVDLVLADLAPRDALGQTHDAGALPLLSHALRAAWEASDGRVLTIADYRAVGGIEGAIARTAETAFTALDDDQRDTVRSLFLRLVTIDDVAVTRRRIGGSELAALRDTELAAIVDDYVEQRLLTSGDGTLEISHEALLAAWPRLRAWIDDDRIGLQLHRQVTEAANAWDRSGRDEALLLRGPRLDAATQLGQHPTLRTDLNPLETDYVAASTAERDADRQRARRRTRRLRRLLAAVVVLLLSACGLAGYALDARSNATAAERDARSARDDALSRQVAVESRELADRLPALAQQLALASFRIAPTAEARAAVIEASVRPRVTRVLGRFGFAPLAMAPRRRLVATGQASSGQVRLLTLSGSGASIAATLPGHKDSVQAVAFAPDEHTLYAVTDAPRLDIWNVADARHPTRTSTLPLPGLNPRTLAVTPDGAQLVVAGAGREPVRRWDVTGTPRRLPDLSGVPTDPGAQVAATSPDGRYLAVAGHSSQVYLWRTDRLAAAPRTITVAANLTFSLLFAPGRLYVGSSAGKVTVLDPANGARLAQFGADASAWVLDLTLSPDGRTLGAGGSDNSFRQYSTDTFKQVAVMDNPAQVTGAAYLPDGSGVVLTCGDGGTYVQSFSGDSTASPATTFNLGFDRSGSRMVAASDGRGGGVQVWDVRGARPTPVTPLLPMTGTTHRAVGSGAISPDGTLVASGNFTGDIQLYDLRDPAHTRAWGPPFRASSALVESAAFDPSGRVLAVASDDHRISLWDVSTPSAPALLSRLPGGDIFYGVAWSPDGALLAGANVNGHAYLWSSTDPRHPHRLATLGGFDKEVWSVAFSHHSHLLAATGSDHTTRLWNVRRPAHPVAFGRPLTGPTDYAYSASFSADDSMLAVGSNDRTVRLFDLRSSRATAVANLDDVGGAVFAVAFSPDGRRLVGAGRSASQPVWTIDPDVFARHMCAGVGTPISRSEWAQYVPGAAYDDPCR